MGIALHVDLDPAQWMAVPHEWPFEVWATPAVWSTSIAEELHPVGGTGDVLSDEDAREGLRVALLALALSRLDFPADRTYAYYADGRLPLSTMDIAVFPAVGRPDERHRYLGRVEAPGSVGAVQVDEFCTDRLGSGVRVLRFESGPASATRSGVLPSLRYFWRIGTDDVAVNVSCAGMTRLIPLLGAVEDLLKAIEVVPG